MSRLTLDWLNLIALLGAVQGLFLAGVLLGKGQNRTANRLLASAIVAFTLFLVTSVYHAAGLVRVFPHFFGIGYPMPLLFGPLIYLYAVTASNRERGLTHWDVLHFVPFLLTMVWGMPVYLMSGAEKVAFYEGLLRGEQTLLMRVVDPLKYVSGISYAVLTILFLQRHRERVKDSYSYVERVNLRWLFWLGISAASIWALAVVFQLLDLTGMMRFQRADDVISLAVAVLVYGIGYMGLGQPEVFRFEASDAPVTVAKPAADAKPATEAKPPAGIEPARYERSGLSEAEATALKDALLAVMETRRPWEDSELTLADLAELLKTTPHKVSEVLNARLGQTFYDFVNGYRVREVQRRIARDKAKAPTLLALALEAGFASKSTFNDAFKRLTGQTPSEYRRAAAR